MRTPIQSKGVYRGPDKGALIAASGACNPQFNFGGLLKGVAKVALPAVMDALG